MRRYSRIYLWLTLGGLLGSGAGWTQTPLGPEIRVNEEFKGSQTNQTVAVAADGNFLVTWQGFTGDQSHDVLWGQWYTPAGQPIGRNRAIQRSPSQIFQPALGPGLKGGVSIFWRQELRDFAGVSLRFGELDAEDGWLSPPRSLTTLQQLGVRFIRRLPQGGYVVALIGRRRERIEARTFLLFTDAEGRYLRGPSLVYPAKRTGQYVGSLSVSPSGKFLVTWSDEGDRGRVLAQLFSPDGRTLGSPVQVHDDTRNNQYLSRSVALGDQGYVVVWNDEDYETGLVDLKMRFLDPDGKPRSPVQRVNEELRHTFLGGEIAADKDGNFFVVWQEGGPPGTFGRGWDVWGRLFRPDGRPVGPKRVLNSYTLDDQTEPFVTAGANGTFIVVWQSFDQDGDYEGIFGQIFTAASPAVGDADGDGKDEP